MGTASHPDMQNIRLIRFFFDNRLHRQFGVGKKFYIRPVLGYIFIRAQIKHKYTIPDMYLTIGKTFKPYKMCSTITKKKKFT